MNMDQDLYECSVCLGPFTKPKLIDCHHTFCLRCLENLVDHNAPRTFVKCPLCNKRSKIPEGGVTNFTTNFYLEKPANRTRDEVFCKNHSQLRADSYCKDCKTILCSKCILHSHKDHNFLDLECGESTNQIVEEFSQRKEQMVNKMEEFQIFQTILEDKSCELDDFAAHTIKDVQRHVENVCAIIKDMGATVVQEIEQNLDRNKLKLKLLRKEVEMINSKMAPKVREMEKSLKLRKTLKIVETMAELKNSPKCIENFHSQISLPDISCLSFVESQNKFDMDDLGVLVPVQSPLMVTGFEELLTDSQLEQGLTTHSMTSQETDVLVYIDEPSTNNHNLSEPFVPCKPLTGSYINQYLTDNNGSVTTELSPCKSTPVQTMEIQKDTEEQELETDPSDPVEDAHASNVKVLTMPSHSDKAIPGYAEVNVNVKDFDFCHKRPVISGVTWGITIKRLGNMLCLYLDQPIEGNINLRYCEVDCQLSVENKKSDLTIRRQFENQKFEPGGDNAVSLECNWLSVSDISKHYIDKGLITIGIFMKYKTIHYH